MAISKANRGETHFLNVDLDIYSRSDLQPLVDAFGKAALALHVGRFRRTYRAVLEVSRIKKDADTTIRAFCELIRALPRPAKRIWNEAKRREFSVGIQAADEPNSKDFALTAGTLMQAARVGAGVVITVYAPERSVVTRDPAVMSGEPVFRGTGVLVTSLFEYLEAGKSLDEFLEGFPTVTRGQALTLFQEAKGALGAESEILMRARTLLRLAEG